MVELRTRGAFPDSCDQFRAGESGVEYARDRPAPAGSCRLLPALPITPLESLRKVEFNYTSMHSGQRMHFPLFAVHSPVIVNEYVHSV